MDKLVVLYTMEGCPFCDMIKNQLNESNIEFYDRDISEYEEEFDMFTEITGSDYVPAFMLIEQAESETPKTTLFSPDVHYDGIDEGVKIIKNFIL